jgi:hypothetical protein
MRKGLLVVAVALACLVPLSASAAGHVVVMPRLHVGGWYGPVGPYWGPFWGAAWGPGYGTFRNTGDVKLDTKVKDAQVFVNGAYVGTTHDNKTLHLRPGGYKIEIKEGDRTPFAQSVYVQVGKTLHLHPEL